MTRADAKELEVFKCQVRARTHAAHAAPRPLHSPDAVSRLIMLSQRKRMLAGLAGGAGG